MDERGIVLTDPEWELAVPRLLEIREFERRVQERYLAQTGQSGPYTGPFLLASRQLARALYTNHPTEFALCALQFLIHHSLDDVILPAYPSEEPRIHFLRIPESPDDSSTDGGLASRFLIDAFASRVIATIKIGDKEFKIATAAPDQVFATQFADTLYDRMHHRAYELGQTSVTDSLDFMLDSDPHTFARAWDERMDRYDDQRPGLGDEGDDFLMELLNKARTRSVFLRFINLGRRKFGLQTSILPDNLVNWTEVVASELDLSDELEPVGRLRKGPGLGRGQERKLPQ